MHLGNGRYLIAELPIEHLAIYSDGHPLELYNAKGTACACCEDEGVHLVISSNKKGTAKFFELYTSDWTVMTKDHIVPKSKGGKDRMTNYQPLCRWCNSIKSDLHLSIEELRELIRYKYGKLLEG